MQMRDLRKEQIENEETINEEANKLEEIVTLKYKLKDLKNEILEKGQSNIKSERSQRKSEVQFFCEYSGRT